jgi:UDP-N-acetylglucosamine 4,6-dehydratase (inverting)
LDAAPPIDWDDATILLTGGTGTFGRYFIERLLSQHRPRSIRVFSRDEFKQSELRARFEDNPAIRYLIGDVRDRDRLSRASDGADIIVHTAALKQVPACEYNPFEAVLTNVNGAENVVNAALDVGVPRVLNLSTDKAVNPINLYGATKLCAEKIMVQAGTYASRAGTIFASVRYGNVVGSRGSILPLFLKQRDAGMLTVTDERMTRFWITPQEAVDFVLSSVEQMRGGEVFVPKIPSMSVVDLAEGIAPGVPRQVIGIRPGEKLHEVLLTADEARHTVEQDDRYVILPEFLRREGEPLPGTPAPEGFTYSSDTNDRWVTPEQLEEYVKVTQGFMRDWVTPEITV